MAIADRLKYARRRAGLTGAKVMERTGIGESSLSDFENARREPKLSQLDMLAKAYSRPISFLLSDEPIPAEVVLWRERPEKAAEELEARFLRLCEQYHNLEVWCKQEAPPQLPQARGSPGSFYYDDAGDLAEQVRQELKLGDRPGQELLRVLAEVRGVKLFHLPFGPTGTAATTLSESFGPAILLNTHNVQWRRNFDLAHELFHLLTWSIFRSSEEPASCSPRGEEEKLANWFASCLLMPEHVVRTAVKSYVRDGKIPYEAVFDLARQFDVSIDALVWRMHNLFHWEHPEETKRVIESVKAHCLFTQEREQAEPLVWPARYQALAVRALRHGEISLGRFAEYLEITRQKAAAYIERETDNGEEIQLTPA